MTMNCHSIRASLAFIAVCISSGCVPFPQRVDTTPWVTGKLEAEGSPIANREVRVFAEEGQEKACEGNSVQATTNEFGKFVVPAQRKMAWVMVMMAHRRFHWSLCVRDGDQWKAIKQKADYTLVDEGPYWLAELRCSIAQDNNALVGQCDEAHRRDYSKSEVEQWLRRP
jgi:hypothetical protein